MKPRILITSAKGNTGFPTAQQLVEDGYPVRLFIRSENARIRQLKSKGAEVFINRQLKELNNSKGKEYGKL